MMIHLKKKAGIIFFSGVLISINANGITLHVNYLKNTEDRKAVYMEEVRKNEFAWNIDL